MHGRVRFSISACIQGHTSSTQTYFSLKRRNDRVGMTRRGVHKRPGVLSDNMEWLYTNPCTEASEGIDHQYLTVEGTQTEKRMWRSDRHRVDFHWSKQRQRTTWSDLHEHMKRCHDIAAGLHLLLVRRSITLERPAKEIFRHSRGDEVFLWCLVVLVKLSVC